MHPHCARLVISALLGVALLMWLSTWALAAGDGTKLGEGFGAAVIRGGQATPAVTVAPPSDPGQAELLEATRLRRQLASVLGFLVDWGGGRMTAPDSQVAPQLLVTVQGQAHAVKTVTLVLPFAGLGIVRDASGAIVGVSVRELAVRTPAGALVRGRGVVAVSPDGTVTGVAVE